MAKKRSFVPGILLTIPEPTPTSVVGGGTGQGTPDGPVACNYEQWLNEYAVDYDNNGYDRGDYRRWFELSFGEEAEDLWGIFNDDPWVPNPNIVPMPVIDPTESPIPAIDPGIEP